METQGSQVSAGKLPPSVDSPAQQLNSPPGTPSISWNISGGSSSSSTKVKSSRADVVWTARENVVVKNRQGSVLTRGLILKTDHFAGLRRPNLGVHLQGAPNFRQAGTGGLEVYGVAQPTISGVKTILSVLQCAPPSSSSRKERANGDIGKRRGSRQEERKGRQAVRSGTTLADAQADRAASVTPRLEPSAANEKATTDPPSLQSLEVAGIEASRSQGTTPPNSEGQEELIQKTALSKPDEQTKGRRCVWACTRNEPVVYVGGRPFVLREAERPIDNFSLSERADNLEGIEQRLKSDILNEAGRYGGLLMVHEEDEQGGVRPAWVAVDADEVKTLREVWEGLSLAGWRCDYHRIPIAEDQPMENN